MPRDRTRRRRNTRPPSGSLWIASSHVVLIAKCVSDASNGVDQLVTARQVDLRSKLADEHIESIAFNVAILAPSGFNHAATRNHAACIPYEQFQQYKLSPCERHD